MKRSAALLLFSLFIFSLHGQGQGKLERKEFKSGSLVNNPAGESSNRMVSVYLPPGYDKTSQRYPVIYFLHGFSTTDKDMTDWFQIQTLMDSAIAAGHIRPVIVVFPNSDTKYRGSFYTNSSMGNWADFITKDLVNWVDQQYRTLASASNRVLTGHSMGGNGSLKLAMQNPDVFSMVYALSPAVLNWHGDFNLNNPTFKRLYKLQADPNLKNAVDSIYKEDNWQSFYSGVYAAMGIAYTPDPSRKAFPVALPVTYIGDSAVYHPDRIQKWEDNFPYFMIDNHLVQLKKLKAIKLDWGRNEDFSHIPVTALAFSKKLEAYGIEHEAEEYIGDHGNKIGGFQGRFFTEVLPFFERNWSQ
ncbi:alpha/beta hydrolase [Flavihumibacter cheonanensis]|uniref:alpha/beta hydrolase n=1 Tax=Flavihumibacter cheonanensis TaxID=1442385 RepID=UPI001EF8D12E|nr:alpha/beta fold hydrolase [Flavihumibacter cheonanensis]MCG7750881.1 alpha/beta fold hydrolase [Flavihumibacter cheonanensis]